LAWLIGHGTREGTQADRRVHGFVPLAGESTLTATWTLAQQLLVAARTPGELVSALAGDTRRTVIVLPDLHAADDPGTVVELALLLVELEHVRLIVEARSGSDRLPILMAARPAVMDLDDAQWTDPERYAVWAAEQPSGRHDDDGAELELPDVDLDDPLAICAADPWQVTRLYERAGDSHGGLRTAWLRAGTSLTREQGCADRALVLLTALGDDSDPRLPQGLAALSEGADWEVVWRRVRGDVQPPWPGPARALSAGQGELAGKILIADHQGTVRLIDETDAAAVGRLPEPVHEPRAVAAAPDGMVLALDGQGLLHNRRSASAPKATGIQALLDDGPTPLERLVNAVNSHVKDQPGTALALSDAVLAVADAAGQVHAFFADDEDPEPRTARLHEGLVTALATLSLVSSDDEPAIPLLYSGGRDGRVRAWGPAAEPLAAPLRSRPCPVTALAAAVTDAGPVLAIGWADGLVEHHPLDDDGRVRTYRPGLPVRTLGLTTSALLLVGTDETLVCLRPV
jgi:hypothetical protein